MRLGLLGGTFNPIHLGHLRGAEEAREKLHLETICFIPAAIPPHKDERIRATPAHRLEMVRLATRDNPTFSVSDVELSREGKSYSIETVHYFRDRNRGAELFFIVGMDSFLEVTTWKSYKDLFSLCHFVVLDRPSAQRYQLTDLTPREFWSKFSISDDGRRWIYVPSGLCTHFLKNPVMDISSRDIRERIRTGRSVRYMMKEEVEAYISNNGFYAEFHTGHEDSI